MFSTSNGVTNSIPTSSTFPSMSSDTNGKCSRFRTVFITNISGKIRPDCLARYAQIELGWRAAARLVASGQVGRIGAIRSAVHRAGQRHQQRFPRDLAAHRGT
jgi:hypothetical protein